MKLHIILDLTCVSFNYSVRKRKSFDNFVSTSLPKAGKFSRRDGEVPVWEAGKATKQPAVA